MNYSASETKRKRRPAVSKILIEGRERAGMKQSELAREAGCGRSAISMYECGLREPSWEDMLMLTKILNIRVVLVDDGSGDTLWEHPPLAR
mgnify:CR=1 FL=1